MKLILFTGAPASGKSSFAEKIGKNLNIDVKSKDDYKIELFEKFGFNNHEEKKKLSIMGENMLYDSIIKSIKSNKDLIVDNNFKNFDKIRDILKNTNNIVNVKCVVFKADYCLLAKRYNDRIKIGNRHPALYTLNVYPIVDGVSIFHKPITENDVARIQNEVTEEVFGNEILTINTNNIETDFDKICQNIIRFILS